MSTWKIHYCLLKCLYIDECGILWTVEPNDIYSCNLCLYKSTFCITFVCVGWCSWEMILSLSLSSYFVRHRWYWMILWNPFWVNAFSGALCSYRASSAWHRTIERCRVDGKIEMGRPELVIGLDTRFFTWCRNPGNTEELLTYLISIVLDRPRQILSFGVVSC